MPRLIQFTLLVVGLSLTGILEAETTSELSREEQKREVASAGVNTATKVIIVLLLFFVMSAMRTISRKKLERARQRRVKPWEDNGKRSEL